MWLVIRKWHLWQLLSAEPAWKWDFQRSWPERVSNGLCEHLRECEQCVYFCEQERAGINFLMRAASAIKLHTASSEHFLWRALFAASGEQRANFAPAGISLYPKVVLRQVICLTLWKQDNRHKTRQHDKALSLFNHTRDWTQAGQFQ